MPDKEGVDDLTQEFIAESMEGLDRMEHCLTELELRPEDSGLVAEIFRAVHTIKGTTGFLGFGRLEKLAHAGETLLGELRDGKLSVSKDLISGLLRLMDGLRKVLRLIADTDGEGNRAADEDSGLIACLTALNEETHGREAEPIQYAEPLENRADLSPSTDSSPVLPNVTNGLSETKIDARSREVAGTTSDSISNDKSIRISVEVLDRMMNLVGDLVLTRNQILQTDLAATTFPELARRLDGITADLRETVMQARMQPVGNLFFKFPRMVRDLAIKCGRQVRLEFTGADTGLDKSLLEAIKDPLTHAVRNAIDHGIEPSHERLIAGKPAQGCIRLKAFHRSGFVVIEISDDGAGIEIPRVLAKAVERGLVTSEQAEGMTELEALQLIFMPGFSTAAAVTHVSGRGVGMDVVRSNVEKVGGSVEVESRAGVGTTLRLRVPLTLAIVPALVVRSGGQSFALPQSALVELLYVSDPEAGRAVERIGGAAFYRLRERLLPLIWLDELLDLAPERKKETGFYVAVLETDGRRFGLAVDELRAPEEIVVKPLSAVLREIGLFSGATVLGNGTLALILDVTEAAERAGVKAIEVSAPEVDQRTSEVESVAEVSLLVFEERVNERKALPLKDVERIESVPLEQIEFVGGRPMLQYRGELLSLEDQGGVVQEMMQEVRESGDAEARGGHATSPSSCPLSRSVATVLICGERRLHPRNDAQTDVRRRGRVVRRVVDVTTGTLLTHGPSAGAADEVGLALVNARVTMICSGIDGAAGLREVA